MRIVELPLPLCPTGKLALAILVERPTVMHTGHVIWLGDNFDFDGSTPPESYQVMDGHSGFAQIGNLVSDYSADTETLDFVGVTVAMSGADKTLSEQTSTNGLANDVLIFVGNEILSIIGIALIGLNTYQIQVARGRFSTALQSHAAGETIHIISREDLLALSHPTFHPGATVTFKVATSKGRYTQDLSEVEPIEIEMEGLALSVAPLNLRVNGEQRNARYTATTDVKISWSLPESRAQIVSKFGGKVRTLLEIVSDVDDSVLWDKLTFDSAMKITGLKMDLIRGAETTFTVRISTDVLFPDNRIKSNTVTLNVT